jgi:hypothetical protein
MDNKWHLWCNFSEFRNLRQNIELRMRLNKGFLRVNFMRITPYPEKTTRQCSTAMTFISVVLHSDTRSGQLTTFQLRRLYYSVEHYIYCWIKKWIRNSKIWSTILEFTCTNWVSITFIFGEIFDPKSLISFQTPKYVIWWKEKIFKFCNSIGHYRNLYF